MRIKLVVVLAVVAALAQAGPGSAQSRPYYVDGAHFFVKPTFRIDVSGTGSWYIGKTHWLSWSPSGASAMTTFYTNVCKPNCAAGRLRSQRAKVRLSAPVA